MASSTMAVVDIAAVNIGCRCSVISQHLYLRGKYPAVQLLGRWVALFLTFEETPHCFPEWLHQFAFPPAVQEGSPLSTSSSTQCRQSLILSQACQLNSRNQVMHVSGLRARY